MHGNYFIGFEIERSKEDYVQLGVASQGATWCHVLTLEAGSSHRLRVHISFLVKLTTLYSYVPSNCSSILTTTSPDSTSYSNSLSCQGPLPFDRSLAKLTSVRPRKSDEGKRWKIN